MFNSYIIFMIFNSVITVMGVFFIYGFTHSIIWATVWVPSISIFDAYLYVKWYSNRTRKCQKRLKGYSDEQVRGMMLNLDFYYPDGFPPMILLKELKERGCDIGKYNDMVLGLLESPDECVREFGVAAFFYMFPNARELFKVCKYNIGLSAEKGREAVGRIREQLGDVCE